MNERVETILEHMTEDAKDIIAFTLKAGSFESFCQDTMVRKAIIMSLLNIGELAKHLPDEFTNAHSEIPWRSIIGMRNLTAHGYHIMNLSVVWDTATTSVPELLVFLQNELLDNK